MTPSDDVTLTPALDQLPPVTTDEELRTTWRRLLGPLGFEAAQLWLLVFDESGRCLPLLPRIDDIPARPTAEGADGLMTAFGHLVEAHAPGGSIAVLIAAPGRGLGARNEARWAAELSGAARRAGVACRRTYAADDHELRPVEPDDLPAGPVVLQ